MLNLFNTHYRKKYGRRVDKITLGLGIECPNRKSGGCSYCSPAGFTPYYLRTDNSIQEQINTGKEFLKKRKSDIFLGYFQQETFTAAPVDLIEEAITTVLNDDMCAGIIMSTRPDYVTIEFLEMLAQIHRQYDSREFLIELGVQSSNDQTLLRMNRGHDWTDTVNAMCMIGHYPFISRGAHLILGLPGEKRKDYFNTLHDVIHTGVNYLKIHHLQIVKGSPLEKSYNRKKIELFSFSEYIQLLCDMIGEIPGDIILHRLWSTCSSDLLVAPQWNRRSYEIYDTLKSALSKHSLYQGKNRSNIQVMQNLY